MQLPNYVVGLYYRGLEIICWANRVVISIDWERGIQMTIKKCFQCSCRSCPYCDSSFPIILCGYIFVVRRWFAKQIVVWFQSIGKEVYKWGLKKFFFNALVGTVLIAIVVYQLCCGDIFSWSGDDSLTKLYCYFNHLGKEYSNED